jgi:hypothetical protein
MSHRLKRISCCALAALLLLLSIAADGRTTAAPQEQTRCGWFYNPSPNNASLIDRDGEWAIAVQGQFDAKGDWPEFKKSQWVSSGNASYGHGCACMRVVTDPDTHRIMSIASSTVKPLATCRRDKALKAPRRQSE